MGFFEKIKKQNKNTGMQDSFSGLKNLGCANFSTVFILNVYIKIFNLSHVAAIFSYQFQNDIEYSHQEVINSQKNEICQLVNAIRKCTKTFLKGIRKIHLLWHTIIMSHECPSGRLV